MRKETTLAWLFASKKNNSWHPMEVIIAFKSKAQSNNFNNSNSIYRCIIYSAWRFSEVVIYVAAILPKWLLPPLSLFFLLFPPCCSLFFLFSPFSFLFLLPFLLLLLQLCMISQKQRSNYSINNYSLIWLFSLSFSLSLLPLLFLKYYTF